MEILTKERIVEELNKILVTPKPSIGFRLLDETGLMDYILPQLMKLKGVETVEALQGRGGGRSGFAQGSIQADRVAIEAFFNT